MNKEEIENRIKFLKNSLVIKKKAIEKELFELEKLCKEIIQLENINVPVK